MKKTVVASLLAFAATAALAQNHPHGMPPGQAKKMHARGEAQPQPCHECGVVQDVKYEKRKGEGGAVGIVAGAAAGGLLGNQFGKGDGKTALTVAGAVGGGFVGNEVQKRVTAREVWITHVKMRDGSVRTFEHEKAPGWKAGTQVKVQGKSVVVAGS
ncbi:MAG TPA: glycine zipper 2TM domain-containing protein [Ramlibacter sp.]